MNEEKTFFDFQKWYKKTSDENNGLILQATAARLLNTPRQNINRMIKIGKIKTYKFDDNSEIYIGMNQIEDLIRKKIKRAKEAQNIMINKNENIMEIICGVDVTDIINAPLHEWAEEWIIERENEFIKNDTKRTYENFDKFIKQKKNKWIKNHDRENNGIRENKEEKYKIYMQIIKDGEKIKYGFMQANVYD